MALVDKDDMTTLFPASDSKATAQSAEDDIQLKAVAFAINSAANTGQLRVIFQEEIRPNVKTQLENNGYKLDPVPGTAKADSQTVISWK